MEVNFDADRVRLRPISGVFTTSAWFYFKTSFISPKAYKGRLVIQSSFLKSDMEARMAVSGIKNPAVPGGIASPGSPIKYSRQDR